MSHISIQQQVYLAITHRGTSVSALAKAIGMTRQNLHRKINRSTLKKEELHRIAKALGCKYESYFLFQGDVIIGDSLKKKQDRYT